MKMSSRISALELLQKFEGLMRKLADVFRGYKRRMSPLEREAIFLHPGLLPDVYPKFAYASASCPRVFFLPPYVRIGLDKKEKKR
jgi:hypothetical protein